MSPRHTCLLKQTFSMYSCEMYEEGTADTVFTFSLIRYVTRGHLFSSLVIRWKTKAVFRQEALFAPPFPVHCLCVCAAKERVCGTQSWAMRKAAPCRPTPYAGVEPEHSTLWQHLSMSNKTESVRSQQNKGENCFERVSLSKSEVFYLFFIWQGESTI